MEGESHGEVHHGTTKTDRGELEMKWILRPALTGVLLLIILTTACNMPVQTPNSSEGTILPDVSTLSPTATETDGVETSSPIAAIIPITGENVVQMQCQFCVNTLTHVVFVFPDFAIFDVETTNASVTCLTAEVINGKRVLVCNGKQNTTFNLKICSDASNCLLFPVALQPCPLVPNTGGVSVTNTPMTPVYLTAINTLRPNRSDDETAVPSQAPTQPGAIPTLSTPIPTTAIDTPVPTPIIPTVVVPTDPIPTDVINPTAEPTDPPAATEPPPTTPPEDHRKDTKTPKP